jgi:hypothetical protein
MPPVRGTGGTERNGPPVSMRLLQGKRLSHGAPLFSLSAAPPCPRGPGTGLCSPIGGSKGMLFSCLPSGIQNRFLDVSQQAAQSPLFPASVGLRSQAMKLRFVSPETNGWFIKPVLPFREVMAAFLTRFNRHIRRADSSPVPHRRIREPDLRPFYVGKRIMDAVLNQPVSGDLDETFELSGFPGGPAEWRIRFIPTLCPNCGWDMQGRRDAVGPSLQKLRIHVAGLKAGQCPGSTWPICRASEDENTVYLPFWRIKADVSASISTAMPIW